MKRAARRWVAPISWTEPRVATSISSATAAVSVASASWAGVRNLSVAISPAWPAKHKSSSNSSWTDALNRNIFSIASTSTSTPGEPSSSSTPSSSSSSSASVTSAANASDGALSTVARELIQELKLQQPSPTRSWQLFQQLEALGQSHTIPLHQMHSLLRALQPRRSARSARHLSVQESTQLASAYTSQIELVRLRIRQRGGEIDRADLVSIGSAFHWLNYAPGAMRVWDESIQSDIPFRPTHYQQIFETMCGWVKMHEKDGGKALAKVAAEALVSRAIEMLAELGGDLKRTDACLTPFFRILIKSGNSRVFFSTFEAVYGFDVDYPGAPIAAVPGRRTIGETQVTLILEMLSEKEDLSSMMAVFESFDNPLPSPLVLDNGDPGTLPSFFARSFSFGRADPVSNEAKSKPIDVTALHPIGTKAYTLIIELAGRLGNGAIMRHYFYQLYQRWQLAAEARLAKVEQVLESEVASAKPDAATPDATTLEASAASSEVTAVPRATSSAPRSLLAIPPTAPEHPYVVPWTVVQSVLRHARGSYDYVTLRFLRKRCIRILQLMQIQSTRVTTVLESPHFRDQIVANGTLYRALTHELHLIDSHQTHIVKMLEITKRESNTISAWWDVRRKELSLSDRMKQMRELTHNSGDVPSSGGSRTKRMQKMSTLRIRVRRKESQVLLARILLVKHRLARLFFLGKRKGHREFDLWYEELAKLNRKRDGLGMGETSLEQPREDVVQEVVQQQATQQQKVGGV